MHQSYEQSKVCKKSIFYDHLVQNEISVTCVDLFWQELGNCVCFGEIQKLLVPQTQFALGDRLFHFHLTLMQDTHNDKPLKYYSVGIMYKQSMNILWSVFVYKIFLSLQVDFVWDQMTFIANEGLSNVWTDVVMEHFNFFSNYFLYVFFYFFYFCVSIWRYISWFYSDMYW